LAKAKELAARIARNTPLTNWQITNLVSIRVAVQRLRDFVEKRHRYRHRTKRHNTWPVCMPCVEDERAGLSGVDLEATDFPAGLSLGRSSCWPSAGDT
jgi:hypothetical protein